MSAHSLFAAFLLSSLVLLSFYLLERFLLSYIRLALCCSAPSRALASSLDFNHKERTYSSMGFGLCILLSAHLCYMLDLLFSLMYRFYISLNRTMISIRKSLSYHKLSFLFLTALMLSDQHSIKRMCENILAAVYGTKHTTQWTHVWRNFGIFVSSGCRC